VPGEGFGLWTWLQGGLISRAVCSYIGTNKTFEQQHLKMNHVTREGKPKLIRRCELPLTRAGVVDRIITDICVLDVTDDGFKLMELAPEVDANEVTRSTNAEVLIDTVAESGARED